MQGILKIFTLPSPTPPVTTISTFHPFPHSFEISFFPPLYFPLFFPVGVQFVLPQLVPEERPAL